MKTKLIILEFLITLIVPLIHFSSTLTTLICNVQTLFFAKDQTTNSLSKEKSAFIETSNNIIKRLEKAERKK